MIIPFDEEASAFRQIIELIRQFPVGVAFLSWIAKDDFVNRVVFEKISSEEFERVIEGYIDDLKIASGGAQFYLNLAGESFKRNIVHGKYAYTTLMSEFLKMEKKIVTDLLIDNTYTVVYQFLSSGKVCGSCWAIYDMKNLLQVCKTRNVNLSYPSNLSRAMTSK